MKAKYQLLMSRVLNNFQLENNQIKQTLAHETTQRKELQRELQIYKHREKEWKRWAEQSGAPPLLSQEKGADGVVLTRISRIDDVIPDYLTDEDDVEEQTSMRKSVRVMENYFL